mmetsp:Transcript_4171/g.9095  ORF Transcript_4171/g.9095 Transcript_4171/m.9095 type:complete len:216 (-) Transcript_4171:282-929(-)
MESNEFDGAFKKKAPPRAARRRQAAEDEDPDSSVPVSNAANGAKKSGWGDSGEDSSVPAPGPRRRRAADDDDEDGVSSTAPTSQIGHMNDDDDGATAFIPDLEDEEANISLQVAVAPSHKSSRVQTIMELDQEIDMALPSTSEIGVDLSVLQAFLLPQEQVQEEDEPWNFEHELQTLASELQREQDERESTTLPGQASPKRKAKAETSASAQAVS